MKYYQVDELLKKHQRLRITGEDSGLFVRSWLDFSLSRGIRIIPWLAGDTQAFLKICSHVFKQSIDDFKALQACLESDSDSTATIIAININEVAANQFSLLLNAMGNSDAQAIASTVNNPSSNIANVDPRLANIIIWAPRGENTLVKYKGILAGFSQTLRIGQLDQPIRSVRPLLLGILALGLAAFYWQMPKVDRSDSFNNGIASLSAGITTLRAELSSLNPDLTPFREGLTSLSEGIVSLSPDLTPLSEGIVSFSIELTSFFDQTDSNVQVGKAATVIPELQTISSDTAVIPLELVPVTASKEVVAEKNAMIPDTTDITDIADTAAIESRKSQLNTGLTTVTSTPANSKAQEEVLEQPLSVDLIVAEKVEKVIMVKIASMQSTNAGSNIKTLATPVLKQHVTASVQKIENRQLSLEEQVSRLVDAWLEAWQQQDFDRYSDHYIATFSSSQIMTHRQWLDWRRKRIEKPKWIKLSRSNIKRVEDGRDGLFNITFTLRYSSPYYRDETFKKLSLKLVSGSLKIVVEENLKVTRI